MRATTAAELQHIAAWAGKKNLQLNNKTREMLVARREISVPPEPIKNVERVTTMKILGVTLQSKPRATQHVDEVLRACSGTLYTRCAFEDPRFAQRCQAYEHRRQAKNEASDASGTPNEIPAGSCGRSDVEGNEGRRSPLLRGQVK